MDDLHDLFRRGGRLTWRKFSVLLRKLPQDSHYQTALRDTIEIDEPDANADPTFGPWSLENYQLAQVIDGQNRLLAAYGGGDMPPAVPRPQPKMRRRVNERVLVHLQEVRERHAREAGG